MPELLALVRASEEQRDGAQLDRRQRDEVVRAEEDVELAGVQPSDGLVVDREMEHREEVAALGVVGVDVDLGPLAPREDVLDVERVPAEAAGEQLGFLRRRREEVDPGDVVALKLSDARARVHVRQPGRRPAARTDARQAGHRY